MSKRRRFLLTSSLSSLGFIGVQFLNDQNRFWAIGILGILTALLFAWSLWEGLGRNMTLLTLILPMFFTFGVGIFWFLLPASILTRIPIVIFYGIGIYVLSLTMNIYTVSASIKTIALLRAARGVGFVLTLLTSFLIFDVIISLKTSVWLTVPMTFLFSFPLFLQGLWTVDLKQEFSNELLSYSAIAALVVSEIAGVLYFWPVTVVAGSLFLTVIIYLLLGLFQSKVEGRLFPAIIREHLTVGALIFVAIFITTRWGE